MVDVGGGSTEVVLGEWDGIGADVQVACSVDVGCVRIIERHLRADPPSEEDVGSAEAFATQALAGAFAEVPVQKARTWVGVAGTVTTLSAIAQEQNRQPSRLPCAEPKVDRRPGGVREGAPPMARVVDLPRHDRPRERLLSYAERHSRTASWWPFYWAPAARPVSTPRFSPSGTKLNQYCSLASCPSIELKVSLPRRGADRGIERLVYRTRQCRLLHQPRPEARPWRKRPTPSGSTGSAGLLPGGGGAFGPQAASPGASAATDSADWA